MKKIKYIAFDADDTLWVNEPFFQKTEDTYADLLVEFQKEKDVIKKELFATEMKNLALFGYGAKGFTLSMVETAIKISENNISTKLITQILELGKNLIDMDIELLEGVEDLLDNLSQRYCLIVATKGDLLDQERKLKKSGLGKYFDHIEIMSDKKEDDYKSLLHRLKIKPESFLMIGNSLKSDILPVVELGAKAIHVPFETLWQHEKIDEKKIDQNRYITANKIIDVLEIIK